MECSILLGKSAVVALNLSKSSIVRYYLYSSPEILCKKGVKIKSRYH